MIMLSRNGSLKLDVHNDDATGRARATVELSPELSAQPSDLYDRVFAFAFDVLGVQSVELRVRPSDAQLRAVAAPARATYRDRSA